MSWWIFILKKIITVAWGLPGKGGEIKNGQGYPCLMGPSVEVECLCNAARQVFGGLK